jgi:hypothetical protein
MATSRSLWEWCGHQGLLLAVGIFGSSRIFIGASSFFFISVADVDFSAGPFDDLGRLWEEWQRRRAIDRV